MVTKHGHHIGTAYSRHSITIIYYNTIILPAWDATVGVNLAQVSLRQVILIQVNPGHRYTVYARTHHPYISLSSSSHSYIDSLPVQGVSGYQSYTDTGPQWTQCWPRNRYTAMGRINSTQVGGGRARCDYLGRQVSGVTGDVSSRGHCVSN